MQFTCYPRAVSFGIEWRSACFWKQDGPAVRCRLQPGLGCWANCDPDSDSLRRTWPAHCPSGREGPPLTLPCVAALCPAWTPRTRCWCYPARRPVGNGSSPTASADSSALTSDTGKFAQGPGKLWKVRRCWFGLLILSKFKHVHRRHIRFFTLYFTVIYTVFFFPLILQMFNFNAVTTEITLQGLEIRVFLIEHNGVGMRAHPVTVCVRCDSTDQSVGRCGGRICAWRGHGDTPPFLSSLHRASPLGVFQEGGRGRGSRSLSSPFPQVSTQRTVSLLERVFCCAIP